MNRKDESMYNTESLWRCISFFVKGCQKSAKILLKHLISFSFSLHMIVLNLLRI